MMLSDKKIYKASVVKDMHRDFALIIAFSYERQVTIIRPVDCGCVL